MESDEANRPDVNKLRLLTLRVRIGSSLLPAWTVRANKQGSKNDLAHQSKKVQGQANHCVFGIAWDISCADQLLFDQLSCAAWVRLLNSKDDMIYAKRADGKYAFVNDTFVRNTGRNRMDIVGRTSSEIFSDDPGLLADIVAEDADLLNRTKPIAQVLRKRTNPQGKVWFQLSTKIAIENTTGGVAYIIGICRDVSEQMIPILQNRIEMFENEDRRKSTGPIRR